MKASHIQFNCRLSKEPQNHLIPQAYDLSCQVNFSQKVQLT